MRVLRGRARTRETDADVTGDLMDRTGETGEPGVRVWRPHRQVAFGRRDERADGFGAARDVAEEAGYPAVVRRVGGRACAYTGATVAFVRTEPVTDVRSGLDERYDEVAAAVQRACWRLGVSAQRGEPEGSFCPGGHSLSAEGKIVGLGQRVTGETAMVAGTMLVTDHDAVAGVLEPVYEALGLSLNPDTVGSLARAGGRTEWEAVRTELERALVGDETPTVETVDK
jgi:octanoyl-[GcvH]:protein N-octanoyltransferase